MNLIKKGIEEKRKRVIWKKEIKQYEKNQKREIVRKQIEENRELKHYERHQNTENETDGDHSLGSFSELATGDRIYVDSSILHENENDFLEDYTGDIEMIGSMLIGEIEQKTKI